MRLTLSVLCLCPVVALAEVPMTAEEFDAYTRGKTLVYGTGGAPYGVEEYLENRRVRWAFIGDICREGTWYPAGEMICFVYDGFDTPQCWTFFEGQRGLTARFMNDPASTTLVEIVRSREPMVCLGPDVGV